ncbi:MAG: tRNA (adenosine(37)-N6)-dimethylallyltransferase MiaA [Pseudoflavonifractor sp.]|nr:tRNA (adenosine(37)-N6)-dimethylallyltransferase MiaA [Pseudoflavonifractor sp.]MDY3019782.1 tRNA (adenosine(37)-N6)-dimethylallyltransferase MiaA [Oscillospiraceae bacterium]
MEKNKLIVILGTTACGKSGLGVALAKRYHGEIVSADSRQVYRGLDLGTGKITPEEMEGVPHHMLDVADPGESYSVAQFQRGAYEAIDAIAARGRLPFLVGGTGLYIRAVSEGYVFHAAPPDPALRARLETLSTQELRSGLAALGVGVDTDAWNNRPRLIRLLEKSRNGEDPHAEAQHQPRYDVLTLGVSFPRETVCRRIDERLLARLDAGMVQEVAELRLQGVSDEFLEGLGLEYRYILRYLQGTLPSEDALIDELGRAIKRFAKRQVSWFKKDKDVHWLDMEADPAAEAAALIDAFL